MPIVVKVTSARLKDAARIVSDLVSAAVGPRSHSAFSVSKIFPDQSTGHRARMFSVDLPNGLSNEELARVVERLRQDDSLEYAEIPAAKKPM
jgi:hypothetical protein